ncbi:MAG TPA: phage holin family protein [Thermoanaerobaculia bacterium]|nr:phage holin family protein [Thermoanaerobaculia bacterium]
MIGLLIRWLLNAVALYVVSYLPGIHVNSIATLFVAALVLGLLNALVRPILYWLTLPLTVLTLGLFLIVLNALMLEITSMLVRGFRIDSFVWAIVGAVVLGLISLVTNRIGKADRR